MFELAASRRRVSLVGSGGSRERWQEREICHSPAARLRMSWMQLQSPLQYMDKIHKIGVK